MLGREPIVDREDMHVGVAADAAAQAVVAVEVAEHEAAAVIIDEQRPRTARGRRIVARGDAPSPPSMAMSVTAPTAIGRPAIVAVSSRNFWRAVPGSAPRSARRARGRARPAGAASADAGRHPSTTTGGRPRQAQLQRGRQGEQQPRRPEFEALAQGRTGRRRGDGCIAGMLAGAVVASPKCPPYCEEIWTPAGRAYERICRLDVNDAPGLGAPSPGAMARDVFLRPLCGGPAVPDTLNMQTCQR